MNGVLAAQDAGDGFGVGEVFLGEDALGEGLAGVVVLDGDSLLEDDDAVVYGFVDEVDGAAGDLRSVVQGLVLGVESGEGGEQRGVDVEDAVGEGSHELRRYDAHVSSEADEVDTVLLEACDHLGVVDGTGDAGGWNAEGGKAEFAGGGEAGCVELVREDAGDLGPGETVLADGGGDGEEVGASTGEEDAQALHE